jgi:hypothetical protein
MNKRHEKRKKIVEGDMKNLFNKTNDPNNIMYIFKNIKMPINEEFEDRKIKKQIEEMKMSRELKDIKYYRPNPAYFDWFEVNVPITPTPVPEKIEDCFTLEEYKAHRTMWNMMKGKHPIEIKNPHIVATKNYERGNWLRAARDENVELGLPVNVGGYENERVKVVVNSTLKRVKPAGPTRMQLAIIKKDESEIRPLEKFKKFDDQDRDYWLEHYKIDTRNSNIFEQIHSFYNLHRDDLDFYFSATMRRRVMLIIQNHFITYWQNNWRVKRSDQRSDINYIVDMHKEYEVIGVTIHVFKIKRRWIVSRCTEFMRMV